MFYFFSSFKVLFNTLKELNRKIGTDDVSRKGKSFKSFLLTEIVYYKITTKQ